MNDQRERLSTVLRVRRVQELQAAGEMAKATEARLEREAELAALQERYEANRDVDASDGLVPQRLRDHETRALHAQAVQRGRARVSAAIAAMEERRGELRDRTMAVKAMERLDERLAAEAAEAAQRAEARELDDRVRPKTAAEVLA